MTKHLLFICLLGLAVAAVCTLNSCEHSNGECIAQNFQLKEYSCFQATDSTYVLQSESDWATFISLTACQVCDCMPQEIDVDFDTQTALAIYTINCGNELAVCRNDVTKTVVYLLTASDIDCLIPIESYNFIVVPKIPGDYSVTIFTQ